MVLSHNIGIQLPRLQLYVMLLLALAMFAGCSTHYTQGVREWAQPRRELLAERIESAVREQDQALLAFQSLQKGTHTGDARQGAVDRVGLHTYRFGQSIQMIRDVLAGQEAASPGSTAQFPAVPALIQTLDAVHMKFDTAATHAERPSSATASPYSTDQLSRDAAAARSEARKVIRTLQS